MSKLTDRQKEVIQYELDQEKDILKQLEKHYQKALNDIDRRIRILESDELTQSRIYRLEYQKALRKQVEATLEKLHADEYATIQGFLSDAYTTGFVGAAYDMFGQGVPLIMPIDKNAAVKAVITDSKIDVSLYDALGVDTNKLKKAITAEITRGIAGGLPHSEISRNLANAAKISLGRAKTIVRTEAHRIQEASAQDARVQAVKEGAVVMKQWKAIMDGKVRHSHRVLDGQLVEVDKPFVIDGMEAMYPGDFGNAAMDCNCRCRATQRSKIALGKQEYQKLQERARFFGLMEEDSKEFGHEKEKVVFSDFKKKYINASQMATKLETDNDWSGTTPRIVPKETKKELMRYAESHGIVIPDLKYFDGDPDLLKAEIDMLAEMQREFPVGKKLVLSVRNIQDDGEFASIVDAHITLNAKALRDRAITERNILLGGHFASKTVEDIVAHEYGHLIVTAKGNKSLDIAKNAYYNVFRENITDSDLIMFLFEHVSAYSVQTNKNKKYKEVIPEILAKNNSDASEYTKEFVRLLKGWLTQ